MGSLEEPIVVDLTTGASTSPLTGETITGNVGEITIGGEGNVLTFNNASLVNNSYAAPGATGCGKSGAADAASTRSSAFPRRKGATR